MTKARLQFRWEATDKPADEFGVRDWICKYELSIPLDEHDIRRENENYEKVRDCQIVELGSTKRGSSQEPCMVVGGDYYFDVPYRDGAHAQWDAPKLGNLPIVCIAIDGTVIPKPIKPGEAPPETLVKDPALIGIAEEMKESGGHWRPCTGCYDTEDGHPTQRYSFSPALQTEIGCGCHECGGLGAVWWHMTDEQIADFVKICEEVDTEHQLKMRIVRLEAGVRRFRRAYVSLMETGRDRIISLGGSCDPVDVMEAGDPELRLIDAALAAEGQNNG